MDESKEESESDEDDLSKEEDKEDVSEVEEPKKKPFKSKMKFHNPDVEIKLERDRILQLKVEAAEKAKSYMLMNRDQGKYKYRIANGNNSAIIRKCMRLREERWEEASSIDKLFNFKWTPVSNGINFEAVNAFGTKQLVNHFQNHGIITTKDKLFENMVTYCEH